jgi:hypothetical protein
MKKYWIVYKQGIFLPSFLKKVNSYNRKSFESTIIKMMAHHYSSEKNATKAALGFGGDMEKVIENKEN